MNCWTKNSFDDKKCTANVNKLLTCMAAKVSIATVSAREAGSRRAWDAEPRGNHARLLIPHSPRPLVASGSKGAFLAEYDRVSAEQIGPAELGPWVIGAPRGVAECHPDSLAPRPPLPTPAPAWSKGQFSTLTILPLPCNRALTL